MRAGTDEIAQVAATFNNMLDRLERAVADQRDFLDDAGHELRTPVTIVRGHLETLEDDRARSRRGQADEPEVELDGDGVPGAKFSITVPTDQPEREGLPT